MKKSYRQLNLMYQIGVLQGREPSASTGRPAEAAWLLIAGWKANLHPCTESGEETPRGARLLHRHPDYSSNLSAAHPWEAVWVALEPNANHRWIQIWGNKDSERASNMFLSYILKLQIVNILRHKSQSWAPYIRSNINENNNFKAITFRSTNSGLTEIQEKRSDFEIHTFS